MKVSVVVPVRDEEESIRFLLDGLLGQTLPPDEIVIVDGGSQDRTPPIIEEYARRTTRVRLIRETNALPGRGRNLGAAQARNEWLAFIDAGVEPANDWLARLGECVERESKIDVVFGSWEPVTNSLFEECAAIAYAYAPSKEIDERFIRSRAISSSLMRRSVWRAVGGFPEELRSGEDLLFMNQIDTAGFRVAYTPQALVRWSIPPTFWLTFKRFVIYSRNNLRAGLGRQWQEPVLVLYALMCVCAAILALVTGWLIVSFVAGLVLLLLARSVVAILRNRDRYPAGGVRNFLRLLVLVPLLATIDLATALGSARWFLTDRFSPTKTAPSSSAH
jgi:glycosyltransferase involved in cell wall biosynthesis